MVQDGWEGEGGLFGQEHPGVNERCEKNRQSLQRRGEGSNVHTQVHTHTCTVSPRGTEDWVHEKGSFYRLLTAKL